MASSLGSATLARLWIEANVALFVVLVIAAVLLVLALLTLIFYCWCCRRKTDHWQREKAQPDGSQIELHGNSMDAESAVTAAIRGSGTLEIQTDKKSYNQPEPDYPEVDAHQQQSSQQLSASNPKLAATQDKPVSLENVWIQHVELPLEMTSPDAVEVRTHQNPLPEVRTNHAAAESEEPPMRLPRTVIIPEAHLSSRRSHGNSVYQSDDNEITIVDSDFSDYEDTREDDGGRKRSRKARAGRAKPPWETLPNQSTQELPIRAIDRQGAEYVPTPALSLAEERARRADSLAELDRTLDVFAQQAESAGAGNYRQELGSGGFIEEEEIRAIDRSQVLF